jgi:hypothetical protein
MNIHTSSPASGLDWHAHQGAQGTEYAQQFRDTPASSPKWDWKVRKKNMSKKIKNEPDKGIVESGNWTRIQELVREIKKLHQRERDARAGRTNLLLGQKFLELRKLVTGTDESFNPKSPLGRKWGKFSKEHLKGCGVSRTNAYRCAQAWKAASAIVPEKVLQELAQREEMIGVGIDGDKPFGKYTMAVETAMETEPDFESDEGVDVFVETVLDNPEKAKKSDPMKALYLRVIKGLVAIAKSKLGETMDGKKRELSVEMLRDPLYTLVSTVQKGIEMRGTHEYETANDLPKGYSDWDEVIAKKTEAVEVREAKQAPKPKIKREAKAKSKAKAKAPESAEDITETTTRGYFAKFNRKAKQESQPWEVFQSIDGAKPEFCCRERSKQDAEARIWKLDRMAEEEEQNAPTTTNNEAVEAAAM